MGNKRIKKPKFVRFGSISPVKQEGYNKLNSDLYHAPPAKKGIYAFVENHLEFFLLGGKMSAYGAKHAKYESIKNRSTGEKIKITNLTPLLINKSEFRIMKEDSKRNEYIKKALTCPFFKKWSINKDLSSFTINDYDNWQSWIKKEIKKISGSPRFIEHTSDPEDEFSTLVKLVKMRKFSHVGELWHHLNPREVSGCLVLQEWGSWYKTSYEDYCRLFQKEFSKTRKQWVNDSDGFTQKDFWMGKTSYDHLEVFIEKVQES